MRNTHSALIASIVALAVVSSVSAQTAPNRRDVVEAVSAADPARFACAHTERSCKHDWINAVASALHATDPKWGLNGKRGNPNDISMDVVTWRLGPTDRHVEAFDICGACGGGNPSVTWANITNYSTIGQPGTAIWVRPAASVPPTPIPPVQPPTPTPAPVDLRPVLDAIAALAVKVDAVAALALSARDTADAARAAAASAAHDAREINADRLDGGFGAPAAFTECFYGMFPKPFSGTTRVRICPEEPR